MIPTLDPGFETTDYQNRLHQFFRELEQGHAVFRSPDNIIYLTRYEDCQRLLQDASFIRRPEGSASAFSLTAQPGELSMCEQMIDHWMIYQDPPYHTRLRSTFNRIFIPKAIDLLRPEITRTAESLLEHFPRGESFDFMDAFAYLFPVLVIAAFFAIPDPDLESFKQWSFKLSAGLNSGERDKFPVADEAIVEFRAYFTKLYEKRRHNPGDDLLGLMIKAESNGDIHFEEIIDTSIFMIWAGHETTKLLVSNALLLLLLHEEQRMVFCSDPDSTSGMIEEVARFEPPIQKTSRWSSVDCEFQGHNIPKNTLITAMIGAANRDPGTFTDPHTFNIRRPGSRHLAFGKGIHHCLGAYLARTEAEICFNLMRPLLPRISLVDYQWRPASAFRCLDKLNIRID